MARGSVAAAFGEAMTPEETQMMDDNRAAEYEPQTPDVPEPAPAPEPAPVVVETKAAPAPAAEEADDEIEGAEVDPQTGKIKRVPYGALHAERSERKKEKEARTAAEARATKAETDAATLAGRFQVIQELIQRGQAPQQQQATAPAAPQEIVIPDVTEDPVGHFKATNEVLARQLQAATKQIEDVNKWREAQTAEGQAMQNVNRLTQIAQSHESEFRTREPAYDEAFAYVKSVRDQELQHMGYKDPNQRAHIIQQDALQIAAQALQNNMNAAEVVFNIAKSRGFAAKAPVVVPPHAPVAVAPAVPVVSAETKKIATVARGQAATQSLGQVNGSAPAETSVESLLKMSDADFAKAVSGDKWRELFA